MGYENRREYNIKRYRKSKKVSRNLQYRLVHQSVAIGGAEEVRNFIIKQSRLVKHNNGRVSKQIKLYDYIISPLRFRKMQKKMENRSKLDELIRKQDYYRKTWNEHKKIIKESFDLDMSDQNTISDITQKDQAEDSG